RLGVFGPLAVDDMKEMRPDFQGEVFSTGGLFLGDQNLRSRKSSVKGRFGTSWTAVYLLSPNAFYNFPDTYDEAKADLRALAEAIDKEGGRLGVRLHPRMYDGESYRLVLDELRKARAPMTVLDPLESMAGQLETAEVAFVRMWGGASIFALYNDIPLIGWKPRPAYLPCNRMIDGLPLVAESSADVRHHIQHLKSSRKQVERILHEQRDLLARHIEDPYGDPYDKVLNL
ncbi:MAG: hypothetical protein AAF492_10535, partial [Verrucomicrobiota bacterium]